jgi:hypothetical protein
MSRVSEYATTGEADRGRVRIAWAIDAASGAVIAMLGFPFPFVRASVPTPLFVALILAAIVLVGYLYVTVVAKLLGRTPGMYLMDLGFEGGGPSIGRAARWALGWLLGFGAHPTTGLATRLSGLAVMSTADIADTDSPPEE